MATPAPKTTALTTKKNTAIAEMGTMSVDTIVDRKKKILEVMHAVMKDGEHYGKVGGTQKPTLLKAGAEVLATVFGLAPTFKITRTDLEGGHREYEIVCTLTQFQTGAVLGEGVGSCSTMESKYRWRRGSLTCPKCGKDGSCSRASGSPSGSAGTSPRPARTAAARRSRSTTRRSRGRTSGASRTPTSPTPTTRC
jgi:hypothetical protein